VVATPIGNLEDLTARAIRVLSECDAICAEDTRHTRALLTHLGIDRKPLVAVHAYSSDDALARVVERLEERAAIAVVTDAGTPSVSDPGARLVAAATARGVRIVAVPGPSALAAAISVAGLVDGPFLFLGFLPRDGRARREALHRVATTEEAVVLFEAPGRLTDTLRDVAEAQPGRRACVCREMTKVHEEFVRGTVEELARAQREWLGEAVIVLGPFSRSASEHVITDEEVAARIARELEAGGHAKAIADRIAAWSGLPRRDVYARVVAAKTSARPALDE
jgi:16S rRNA (cytidine1402-2'-O)-methyltransferase